MTSSNPGIEQQIQSEIEQLRAQFPETQDLYREACVLLFFRHGITPTANKLYQYVRKGSMSAPAEALRKFWEHLREKSRLRVEHPDLPDALKAATGDLVATIWAQAQGAAQQELAAIRTEAHAAIEEAQIEKASAEGDRVMALKDLEQARQSVVVAADRALQLERDLAAERAGKEALSIQLVASGRQQAILENALAEARRDFTSELEKLREALQRSEERYEAAENRGLLEIDRERTITTKLQKEVAQLHQSQLEIANRHQSEITQLQSDLGDARQKLGVADGSLREMRMMYQQQTNELQSSRAVAAARDMQNAQLQHELETCRGTVTILEEELRQLRVALPPKSQTTKSKRRKSATG